MSLNPCVVKESFAQIEPVADKAAAYFYGRLFAENPSLRVLFPPAMDAQRERLFRALTRIVWSLDSPDTLAAYLRQLGRDHRKFGVLREHYEAIGNALLATIRKFAGDAWTPEVEEAWTVAYTTAATVMIEAADAAAADAPPWWIAEVVDHELRTPDIAVLTVRPRTPYGHVAGQYAAIQTSRWPRVWRPYSIANAPRDDGLVRFHVRALPGGWVSGALVRHTRIGDTLLLGPAAGTMAVDPESDRDLLCVAGGTGLAPLKAIVEQVADADAPRAVHLVVGARTERDLYDLAALEALADAHAWLDVIPVLSQDPGAAARQGLVPDVLGRLRDWSDHDVYLAGPPAMISKSVALLQDLGVPPDRLRHDPLDVGR
ncbi:MAG TPA: globin domain-containing protein [Streptosporangiaceae bacterium]|jgi:NAD(P)H-flavin reductase